MNTSMNDAVYTFGGLKMNSCRLSLSVSFTPCREGYVNFRLVLKVKKKTEALTLTVTADCFIMNTSVQVESLDGGLREIHPELLDTLDFRKVSTCSHDPFKCEVLMVKMKARFKDIFLYIQIGGRFRARHL